MKNWSIILAAAACAAATPAFADGEDPEEPVEPVAIRVTSDTVTFNLNSSVEESAQPVFRGFHGSDHAV